MTFAEFWQEAVKNGTADTFENRQLARGSWDTALCAAQESKWDENRQPMGTLEWAARIGGLHTWKQPLEGGAA